MILRWFEGPRLEMLKWWRTNRQTDKQTDRISTCRLDPSGRRGRVKNQLFEHQEHSFLNCLIGPSLIHVSEKYFYCSSYLEIGDGLWQMQLKSFTHWLLSNFSRLVSLSPSQIQFCSPSSVNIERLREICKMWSDLTGTIFVKLNTPENFCSSIEIYNFTKKN